MVLLQSSYCSCLPAVVFLQYSSCSRLPTVFFMLSSSCNRLPAVVFLQSSSFRCVANSSCFSHSWLLTGWTSCRPAGDSQCGQGTQTRGRQCVRSGTGILLYIYQLLLTPRRAACGPLHVWTTRAHWRDRGALQCRLFCGLLPLPLVPLVLLLLPVWPPPHQHDQDQV